MNVPLLTVETSIAPLFIELGLAILGLALLTRLANRFGISSVSLFLIAGLAFGQGGLLPIRFSGPFLHTGGEVGVLLLMFMLGLEYTGEELARSLTSSYRSGILDLVLNMVPGIAAGLLLGWGMLPAVLLGGVTYVSSSGIIAKVLSDLKRMGNPETPSIISILVFEDLSMAVYLPIMAVLLSGKGTASGLISIGIALAAVALVLLFAMRFGKKLSALVEGQSDETLLLSAMGLVLLVSGVAQQVQVSAAVGAFLVGVALSGPIVHRTEVIFKPLRDLFAATFFLFFGLQLDPSSLIPVLGIATPLALVTIGTKVATGMWSAKQAGCDRAGQLRAGFALTSRGEFSIVIAGLAGSQAPAAMVPLSAAYVLILAVAGPMLARIAR